jgi:hypothetical protein
MASSALLRAVHSFDSNCRFEFQVLPASCSYYEEELFCPFDVLGGSR